MFYLLMLVQKDNFITEGGKFFRLVHEYTGTEIDLSLFDISEGVFVKMSLQKFTAELPSPDVLTNQFFVPSSVNVEDIPEIVDKAIHEALKNPLKFKSGLPIYKHNTGNTTKAFVTGYIFGNIGGMDFTFFEPSKNLQTCVHLTCVPFFATVPSSPISHSFHYVPVFITRRRPPFLFRGVFRRHH